MRCAQQFTSRCSPFRYQLLYLILFSTLQGCAIQPSPLSLEEHRLRVQEDRQALYANQDALSGPLSLELAIARALKYNYDHRLALMETAFHDQQLTAATYAMLPRLAANAGYTYRDNESASSSISYRTRRETLEPSISSEKERRTGDLTLTWTVLDFGISYFQARQQADRLLIMLERKRRVVNNIVKEVIGAYWKALTAQHLLPLLEKTLQDAQIALDSYEAIQKNRLSPPLETLEQHRDLLSIVSQLRRIQADMAMSRAKFAALINVPMSMSFEIAQPDAHLFTPPPLKASLEELENKGLFLRPDLREEAYQERIDKAEVYKEIIRMLPGATLFAGLNYDSNRYLVHSNWSELGARATMNLFNLITGPMQIRAADTKVDVTRTRRLAQTVAALVQIHLSYYQYIQAMEDYSYSKKINAIEEQMLSIAKSERDLAAQSKLGLIRRSVSAVRARIEQGRALSDIYLFWGNVYFSIGGDLVPPDAADGNLSTMAAAIRARMELWWRGVLPFETEPPQPGQQQQPGAPQPAKEQPGAPQVAQQQPAPALAGEPAKDSAPKKKKARRPKRT